MFCDVTTSFRSFLAAVIADGSATAGSEVYVRKIENSMDMIEDVRFRDVCFFLF